MSDTDFLEQDLIPAAETPPVEQPVQIQEEKEQPFEAPSWEDIKSGKIAYKDLPPILKTKIKNEAYEETPEDKKYLWDEYGFTPPQTYNGVDRNGKSVQGFDLDGFEDLVKRGRIKPKTKIEQDVEDLTHLVKEQNKNLLSQREVEIERKLAETREKGLISSEDFEAYEKIRQEKEDVKFQKLQLDRGGVKPESKPIVDVGQQYSLDEQVAIRTFGENNPEFVGLMQKSKDLERYFDQTALELYQKNPRATPDQILHATKQLAENRFNINKQEKPMFRNTIRPEQKTNIESKAIPRLTYSSLSDRDKKLINSESKSGRAKYAGKTMDDITNMVYGEVYKNMLKK